MTIVNCLPAATGAGKLITTRLFFRRKLFGFPSSSAASISRFGWASTLIALTLPVVCPVIVTVPETTPAVLNSLGADRACNAHSDHPALLALLVIAIYRKAPFRLTR